MASRRGQPLLLLLLTGASWSLARIGIHQGGTKIAYVVPTSVAMAAPQAVRPVKKAQAAPEQRAQVRIRSREVWPREGRTITPFAPLLQPVGREFIEPARGGLSYAAGLPTERIEAIEAQGATPQAEVDVPLQTVMQTVFPLPIPTRPQRMRRALNGGFWLLARSDRPGANALAGPQLGGAQAGFRLVLPVGNATPVRRVSLSARGSAPLKGKGKEAAIGLSLKLPDQIPLEFLAERRIALDPGQRDRTALILAGGVSDRPVAGGWRLEAYGQGGVVIANKTLAFAGAQASIRKRLGQSKLEIGAAAWGDAQRGASRLDLGPELVLRLGSPPARIAAQWRFRVAGNARPESGPALVLSGDF